MINFNYITDVFGKTKADTNADQAGISLYKIGTHRLIKERLFIHRVSKNC